MYKVEQQQQKERQNQRDRKKVTRERLLLKYEFNAVYIIHGQTHLIRMENVGNR